MGGRIARNERCGTIRVGPSEPGAGLRRGDCRNGERLADLPWRGKFARPIHFKFAYSTRRIRSKRKGGGWAVCKYGGLSICRVGGGGVLHFMGDACFGNSQKNDDGRWRMRGWKESQGRRRLGCPYPSGFSEVKLWRCESLSVLCGAGIGWAGPRKVRPAGSGIRRR